MEKKKYKIFTRMEEEPEFKTLEEVKEELEKCIGAFCREDEFIITKDKKFYGFGKFKENQPKIQKPKKEDGNSSQP